MKGKAILRNLLYVIVIVVGGFILFNVAFLLTALVSNVLALLLGIIGVTFMAGVHAIGRYASLLLICLIAWAAMRTKWKDVVKATVLTMPLMTIMVLLGIEFYGRPDWLIAGIGALVLGSVLFYLYKKNYSWLYYVAVFYVGILGLCIMLFHVEI